MRVLEFDPDVNVRDLWILSIPDILACDIRDLKCHFRSLQEGEGYKPLTVCVYEGDDVVAISWIPEGWEEPAAVGLRPDFNDTRSRREVLGAIRDFIARERGFTL